MSSAPSETSSKRRKKFDINAIDISKLLDKQPPHAIEAECALLGSLILDARMTGEVLQIVASQDEFYLPKHAAIYNVLVELYDRNESVDLVQINQRMADLGQLELVGGLDYLVGLAESVPSASSATYYAAIVHEKAILRRLIDASQKIWHEAYTSAEPVALQLDMAEQEIFRIAESKGGSDVSELRALLHELYERLETQEGRAVTGIETGFFDLDRLTSGLQNGEMIIMAARPSMGKTAFAINIAEHMAVDLKQPVAVFSLEMSAQQLAQRLLCSRSGVDAQRVRNNQLSSDDFAKLSMAVGELSEAPLFIDDSPSLTLMSLRAKARRLASRHSIKAIFIDYLQLLSCPGSESRQQEVSELSRGIKALARELTVPVICLSQLNRSPEAREGHRPRMSDLRESGSIEQDADVVMMLHREEYFHNDEEWRASNPDKIGTAEVIIVKQRNGPTDTVHLQFNNSTTRFNNLSTSARYDGY